MTADRNKLVEMGLVACLSVLGTGLGAWFSFGKDTVSVGELQTYVSMASPYIKDAPVIALQQKQNTEAIASLQDAVKELINSSNQVMVMQARLMERYDALLASIKVTGK